MGASGFEGIQSHIESLKAEMSNRQLAEQAASQKAIEQEKAHRNKNKQLALAWVTAADILAAKEIPHDAEITQLSVGDHAKIKFKGIFRNRAIIPYETTIYPAWHVHTSSVKRFSRYAHEYGSVGGYEPVYDLIAQDYYMLTDGSVGHLDRKYVNARPPEFHVQGAKILTVDQVDLAAVTGLEEALARFIVDKNLA